MENTTKHEPRRPIIFHTLLLNLYFSVGYFLLAKFGFAWGALTANSTLLWPPSGLALFALLVFGNRVIPGLLIGAICASQFLSLSNELGNNSLSLSVAAFNGASSILQALVIAYWSRPWYRQAFRTKPNSAIYFSFLVLIGCTIAATLSNLSLWIVNLISFSEAVQSWVVWWLGDSIGMLVITPLLLWLHHRKKTAHNSQANAFLITCAGIGITLFTVTAIGHNERQATKKNLNDKIITIQMLLQDNWDFLRRDLNGLQDYFFTHSLKREEVKFLAESLLKNNTWLEEVSWLPGPTSAATINSHDPDQVIGGFNLSRLQNMTIVTQDLPSDAFSSLHFDELRRAKNQIQFDISWQPLESPQKNSMSAPRVRFIVPIVTCPPSASDKAKANSSTACDLSQVISFTVSLNNWMSSAIEKAQRPQFTIELSIPSKNGQQQWLQWLVDHWSLTAPNNSKQHYGHNEIAIYVFDSQWNLHVTPHHPSLAYLPSVLQWSLLLIGFSLTATLGAYLHALNKHDQLVKQHQGNLESEILAQTEALHAANDWLLKEIEERKEAQEQLKSSENHLRTLLDNIPDPIWFRSIEGHYISANKAVEVLFNSDENKIIGKSANDFASAELINELELFEKEVIDSKSAVRKSLWMYMGFYNELRLMDTIKVALRNDQNEPTGILSIARDVTDQKHVESALQLAKETAEEATHAKSRFLANMSHEIRTPLNAVLGYTQLLIADTQLTPQQRERLDAILSSGQRLLSLINSILDLSKIEAGALHLRNEFFDLHQEMIDSVTLMKEKAAAKHLALYYHIGLPTPAIVKGDRQKIGQIILNLLGNAIKFTDSGAVTFDISHHKTELVFVVTDTGPGIAPDELKCLFSAFRQGKAGQETGGTGLGLVISKHLAEHMGGDLMLVSDEGKGTCATLRLPLTIEYAQIDDQHIHHAPIRLMQGKMCRALVVEDDESSLDILVNLLIDIGCDVIQSNNGADGIKMTLDNCPDIIFTDIRMPVMTGIEMLQILRQENAHKTLPIIAITASNLEHERSFYLEQGFNDFVGKPYEFSAIYAVLERFFADRFTVPIKEASIASHDEPSQLTHDESDKMIERLTSLKEAMNAGDMQQTKKLFNTLSEIRLGSRFYRNIQQSLRQYDLVLAEKWVDEFLTTRAFGKTNI